MRARVKAENRYPTVRSAGLIWLKVEWLPVPAWAEREISACPFLEVEPLVEVADSPPQTVEDKAVKLVDTQPGSRKGKRKL